MQPAALPVVRLVSLADGQLGVRTRSAGQLGRPARQAT
jgi:hypothetical protein